MIPAREALQRLREGNRRFVSTLRFRTRLVVVLGHSQCGAIQATLEHLKESTDEVWPNLRSIIEFIRPAVAALLKTEVAHDWEGLVRQAVRANVGASVKHLRRSEALEHLIEEDGLMVVGADYSLETGSVEFFDDQVNS